MGENKSDQHDLILVEDLRDQSKLIAFDVEHGADPHYICMRVIYPHPRQVLPRCLLCPAIPIVKRLRRVGMLAGEL